MGTASIKKVLFLGVGAIFLVMGFLLLQRSFVGPRVQDDPGALEALKLVQNHSARQAPTLKDAITDLVNNMKANEKGVYLGDWRVASQGMDTYVVSVLIREKGFAEWIERDYAWRVNLKKKSVAVITLPATYLMPFHELPPLPHDSDMSSLPLNYSERMETWIKPFATLTG